MKSPSRFRPRDTAGLYLRGLAMGASDIVPGVSGGTIALVTGIYERFIAALGSLSPAALIPLVRGDLRSAGRELRAIHWGVLIPVFTGVLTAVVLMSRLITGLMDDRPGVTYAFFFGLIIASAWVPFSKMRGRAVAHAVVALLGAVFAWGIVGLQPTGLRVVPAEAAGEADQAWFYPGKIREHEDLEHILVAAHGAGSPGDTVVVFDPKGLLTGGELPPGVTRLATDEELRTWAGLGAPVRVLDTPHASLWWIFCCGAISISAMILPGLSGSFLMLLLGQYHAVLSTIGRMIDHARVLAGGEADPLLALSGRTLLADSVFLGVFACGVVVGLGTFSRVVAWLFTRHHDTTMAALAGLMLGALRLPASRVMDHTGGAGGESWAAAALAAFVGAVLVTALSVADARASRSPGV